MSTTHRDQQLSIPQDYRNKKCAEIFGAFVLTVEEMGLEPTTPCLQSSPGGRRRAWSDAERPGHGILPVIAGSAEYHPVPMLSRSFRGVRSRRECSHGLWQVGSQYGDDVVTGLGVSPPTYGHRFDRGVHGVGVALDVLEYEVVS